MKRFYYYIYYCYYKFYSFIWTEFFASSYTGMLFCMVEALFISCILLNLKYYIFNNKSIGYDMAIIFGTGIIIFVIDYFAFTDEAKINSYIEQFDKLPKRKNNMGKLIVFLITVLIFVSFFLSVFNQNKR